MKELKKIYSVAAYNKPRFIFLTILDCITRLMIIGNALIFGELINMVSRGEAWRTMVIGIVFTLCYVALLCALQWVDYYLTERYAISVEKSMREHFVDKLLNAKYNSVATDDSSKYINNISSDIGRMTGTYVFQGISLISCIVSVIGSFAAAMSLKWEIALTMVGFTVIMGILPLFIKKRLDNSTVDMSKKRGEYIGVIKENLLGLSIVKSFGGERMCAKKIGEKNNAYVNSSYKYSKINVAAGQASNLIRQLAIVSLIAFTCYYIFIGKMEVGAVLSVYSIGSTFYSYIMWASAIVTAFFGVKGLRDMLGNTLTLPVQEKGEDIAFGDAITFENVSFKYPSSERNVLDGIDISLEKGKKYLILGKSGSGKSTILKLLSKLYDNYDGKITIDGKDYLDYSEKDVSALIAVSQQNTYLFNRSLRENIDFLCEGDEEKLKYVIDKCELSQFVASLPDGLDTVIDEEVNQVSGGEKLRINLARALYKSSDILLLDEVTSALDKRTADIVEHNLLAIGDKTVINVCHKFNDGTLPIYDKIVVIENGKIALEGSFDRLKDDPLLLAYRNVAEE